MSVDRRVSKKATNKATKKEKWQRIYLKLKCVAAQILFRLRKKTFGFF